MLNEQRFDALTKAIEQRRGNRRGALRLLGAGTLGGVLGTLGQAAAARCTRVGRKCERGERCCGGARCQGWRCHCQPGRVRCGQRCCANGERCVGGRCVTGAGNCPASADGCVVPETALCDAAENCFCFTTRGGATRCGKVEEAAFCQVGCTTNAACADLGPGAFCAEKTGDACCFGLEPGAGFCVAPCPR